MFKAGRTFKVKANSLNNTNAIIVAPTINLHGLILSVQTPISDSTLKFLNSKGASVQRIEEDGDKLIRLTGKFNITAAEVQKFLAEQAGMQAKASQENSSTAAAASVTQHQVADSNSNVNASIDVKASADVKDVKATLEAVNFQKQVTARLMARALFAQRRISVQSMFFQEPIHQSQTSQEAITIKGAEEPFAGIKQSGIAAGGTLSLKTGTCADFGSGELVCSGNGSINVTCTDGPIQAKGYINEASTGMLGEHISKNSILMNAKQNIELANVLSQAKHDIELQSSHGDVVLQLESRVGWHNASSIPSLTYGYELMIEGRNDAELTLNQTVKKAIDAFEQEAEEAAQNARQIQFVLHALQQQLNAGNAQATPPNNTNKSQHNKK